MSNTARSIYLDFETYYEEKTYSLQYMSIEEYVRSPLFDVQLLCYAIDDDHVKFVIGSDSIRDVLPTLGLDKDNTITFIQNARFDGFILTDYFGIDVANPVCSRAMARFAGVSRLTRESLAAQSEFFGHGEKGGFIESMSGRRLYDLTDDELWQYIEYCQQDVELLRKNVKAMLPVMTADALAFSIMTNKMYTQPRLQVDILGLTAYLGKLQHDRHTALAGLQARFGIASQEEFHKALRSKKKFCELLIQAGGKVPLKLSEKKTQTALLKLQQTLSAEDYQREVEAGAHLVYEPALAKTDAGFMALCASDNPLVAALANTRRGFNSSIEESRAETLLAIGQRGPLPVPLEAFQAITGRYTGGGVDTAIKSDSVNLQNLPKRTGNTTLRQCIKAPDGFVIVAGDSSQVEARVGAWSAGATNLLDDFRSGADPYCRLASNIYDVSYEELWYYTKGAGASDSTVDKHLLFKYKTFRNVGKEGILSCLGGETKCLTSRGLVAIRDVLLTDKLWDGKQWVRHSGVIKNGWRKTFCLDGVWITPNHRVFSRTSQTAAFAIVGVIPFMQSAILLMGELFKILKLKSEKSHIGGSFDIKISVSAGKEKCAGLQNRVYRLHNHIVRFVELLQRGQKVSLTQLLEHAAENLPFSALKNVYLERLQLHGIKCAAIADMNTECTLLTLKKVERHNANHVEAKSRDTGANFIMDMLTSSKMTSIELDFYSGLLRVLIDALIQIRGLIRTMGDAALRWDLETEKNFLAILSHCRDGMNRLWSWIESTTTEDMSPETYGSCLERQMSITAELLESYKLVFKNLKKRWKLQEVYDVVNCGPNNKFTIHTDTGFLVVHNCQYGAGADKIASRLAQQGVYLHNMDMPPVTSSEKQEQHIIEVQKLVSTYRSTYAAIPQFWKQCKMVIEALINGGQGYFGGPEQKTFYYDGRHTVFGRRVPAIMLPDGYWICCPNLRFGTNSETGKLEYLYDQFDAGRKRTVRIYGAKLMNYCTQGLAFAIMRWQALQINKRYPVIANVHDSWASLVPEDKADDALEVYKYWMSQVPEWAAGVPIACEVKCGTDFTVV